MGVQYVKQCKVCNSKFKNLIESLHEQNMNPQKIYDYLQSLTDPSERALVLEEDINPSSIRRHIDKHYDKADTGKIKVAETRQKIEQSRDAYKQGIRVVIDNVNTISHLIETAMIKLEEVDSLDNQKAQHQYTIQYMNTIKSLIESLAKLTGELKQEGTIDINFFSNEIGRFAEIVLSSIREIDKQLGMESKLEYAFANEFKNQWELYVLRQDRIFAGELSPSDGVSQQNVNTFNEGGK